MLHARSALATSLLLASLAAPAVSEDRAQAVATTASALPLATPESQGMSRPRLDRMHAEVRRLVDEGLHSGVVTLVARNGELVDLYGYGKRDLEAGLPMQPDTIFRIYSMSKIVTSVAALVLLEEARFRLTDPVGNYLPELARMKVMTGGTAEKPFLADAQKPITIKDLFTHSSGLIYGFGSAPIDKIYREAKVEESASLADFVTRVSRLPLAHEPGARFSYGLSTDVLGALVEKVSGRTLGEFCEERIFRPLRMTDTGFSVPDAQRGRLATLYEKGKDGKLAPAKTGFGIRPEPGPKLEAGGAGLFSTVSDYARFMQMLLNDGQLEGTRVLSRKTVELMMANHLGHMERKTIEFNDYAGFGLGGAVRLDLARGNQPGSLGEFGWTGAATTFASLDPKEKLVTLVFTQHFPHNEHGLFWRFSTLVYAAVTD
jgi:CubicO group peptidase (beta-lactamase class C family)